MKPVVRRGGLAKAVVTNGSLTVSANVKVLEDGAPGDVVRVQNLVTRKELIGEVVDENTVKIRNLWDGVVPVKCWRCLRLAKCKPIPLWSKRRRRFHCLQIIRPSEVGDIVTVLVQENNSASRNSSTRTEKKGDISASISSFVTGSIERQNFL